MRRTTEMRKQLGEKYFFECSMSMKEVLQLQKMPSRFLGERVVAQLEAGCMKIESILFKSEGKVLLGYEVYVKDVPEATDWICYDSPKDEVDLREDSMLAILDRIVEANGLSYTECCFEKIEGKDFAGIKKGKGLQM